MDDRPAFTNHNIHHAIKHMADELRPHLVMLSNGPDAASADIELYEKLASKLKALQPQVTNHDSFCAIHAAVSLLQRCKEIATSQGCNKELLWQLQEVMALLFKVQNLPI